MTNFWRKLTSRQRNNNEIQYNHLMNIIEDLENRVAVLEGKEITSPENNTPTTDNTKGNVTVTVKDNTGKAIADVNVLVSDGETGEEYEAYTDNKGQCTITNVPVGDWELISLATGYENNYDNITVVAGENTATVTLTKK